MPRRKRRVVGVATGRLASAERLVAAAALSQLAVLFFAARYARNLVEEARRLREARQQLQEAEARPYVMLDFEPGDRPPFNNLVVPNLGKTMASNVRIKVHPSFEWARCRNVRWSGEAARGVIGVWLDALTGP
jgi:hypothetical protein